MSWSKSGLDACRSCGSAERPHHAKGLCTLCNVNQRNRSGITKQVKAAKAATVQRDRIDAGDLEQARKRAASCGYVGIELNQEIWRWLLNGGYAIEEIAEQFGVDAATVHLGVQCARGRQGASVKAYRSDPHEEDWPDVVPEWIQSGVQAWHCGAVAYIDGTTPKGKVICRIGGQRWVVDPHELSPKTKASEDFVKKVGHA